VMLSQTRGMPLRVSSLSVGSVHGSHGLLPRVPTLGSVFVTMLLCCQGDFKQSMYGAIMFGADHMAGPGFVPPPADIVQYYVVQNTTYLHSCPLYMNVGGGPRVVSQCGCEPGPCRSRPDILCLPPFPCAACSS
jgi:hypothetical protein